jgi:capsular exopolysaccharide synthesis family protein
MGDNMPGDNMPAPPPGSGYPARIESPRASRELYVDDWDDEIRFADYWRVLASRRWTILGVAFTVVAATMLWSFRQTPLYRATSRIQIERQDPSILSFEDVYSAEAGTDDGLQTQYEIIGSRTLARRVVGELSPEEIDRHLVGDPGLVGAWTGRMREFFAPPAATGLDPMAEVVDTYLDRLRVNPVRQARLVDISFDHEDPRFAARVIDIHADYFIDQNLRFRFEATQLASDFLSENLTSLKIDLERAEDALQEYSREHQIVFSEDGDSAALQRLQQLQADHTRAENDRIAWEAYIEVFDEGDATAIAQVAEDELIARLSGDLTQLRAEAAELASDLGPRMPETQRLRSRILETERLLDAAKADVLKTVAAEYRAALSREQLLAAAVDTQLGRVNDINQEIVQYMILKGEVDASRHLYQEMLTRLGEANVSSTLRASNIRIIDRATVPDAPVRPRRALNLALSLVVGMGLGVGLAFLLEHMDDSINSTDDIGQYLGVPTLGIVPKATAHGKAYAYQGGYGGPPGSRPDVPAIGGENRLEFISHNEPASLISEAYRSVRTSLLLSFPDRPPRSILVTSPSPSEGKTSTAINVAISLTQTGARTLLVSTDLRKPRIDAVFGAKGRAGISGVLAGEVALEDAISETGVSNLSLLACGTLPPNPVELLMSIRFQELVLKLRKDYEFIVFDSPPVGNVSDARVLARMMDCTILVVRAAETSKHLARHVLDQLAASGSRTAGVILNDFDSRARGGAYPYYSSGYYASRAASL